MPDDRKPADNPEHRTDEPRAPHPASNPDNGSIIWYRWFDESDLDAGCVIVYDTGDRPIGLRFTAMEDGQRYETFYSADRALQVSEAISAAIAIEGE